MHDSSLDHPENMPGDKLANAKPLSGDPQATDHAATHKHPQNIPTSQEEINSKVASDVKYWSEHFKVSGDILHEAVRTHGTSVKKVGAALQKHEVNLT